MTDQLKEKQEVLTKSDFASTNDSKTKKRKTTVVVIITVLSCALIVALLLGSLHYNNTQDAITRVNTLCDEINSCDTETDISKIYNLDKKLKEIDELIKGKKLDDSYMVKYTDCKDYINDLKLYKEIEEALASQNPSDWQDIQININALRTESVRMKISDATIDEIKSRIKKQILYNTLKYFEEYVTDKYNLTSVSGVTDSYYYSVPKDVDPNFILSIPAESELGYVPVEGFGAIMSHKVDFEESCQKYHVITEKFITPEPIQDSIRKGVAGGFIVEYVDNGLNDTLTWSACDFDIDTKYSNGKLEISLIDSRGSNLISMNDLDSLKTLSFN